MGYLRIMISLDTFSAKRYPGIFRNIFCQKDIPGYPDLPTSVEYPWIYSAYVWISKYMFNHDKINLKYETLYTKLRVVYWLVQGYPRMYLDIQGCKCTYLDILVYLYPRISKYIPESHDTRWYPLERKLCLWMSSDIPSAGTKEMPSENVCPWHIWKLRYL
jgi:hypothetical protein